MDRKSSLLSRMRDPEPPDLESMHPTSKTLLQRITQDHDPQTLNLLDRISSLTLPQDLLPLRMQDSIRAFSPSVMHSSKNIERGRYQNPPYMSKSSPNLLKRLEMTEPDPMQLLDHSLRRLRVMTPSSCKQQKGGQRLKAEDVPPVLISRMMSDSTLMESQHLRKPRLMNRRSHGSLARKIDEPFYQKISSRPSSLSMRTQLIPRPPNTHSLTSQTAPNSPILNGRMLYPEEQSVLMPFSVDSSPQRMTTSRSRSSEISKFHLEPLNRLKRSRTEETGQSLGTGLLEPLYSPSLTDCKNSPAMENTLSIFSRSPTPASTIESSPSIKQCVSEPGASGIWSYPILRSLPTLKSHTWTPSESQLCREDLEKIADVRVDEGRIGKGTNLATNGMKGSVAKRKRNVEGTTFVTDAEKEDIEERIAEVIEPFPKRPKYLQKSIWMDPNSSLSFSPTAQCTLTDDPLPRPPPVEFQNSEAIMTINQNPHLFQIVTPIKVDQFKKLLETHPNRPFVESVCTSLREGFWPWAHIQREEYPITWDFSDRPPKNENEAEFLRSRCRGSDCQPAVS